MKKIQAIEIGIVLVSILFWWMVQRPAADNPSDQAENRVSPTETTTPTKTEPATNIPSIQAETVYQIRDASVLIMMLSPILHNETADGTFVAYGMGSLITYRGETLLVTHNHWGEFLQDLTTIEFRDADNRLLKVILGNMFTSLVLYQDAGTLILRAPDGLADQLAPSTLDVSSLVKPGEMVQVVYRENPGRDKVAILVAVVEEMVISDGLPVYKLRSLNGQSIQPGDSGGGVWQDGVLVGNNWSVLMEPDGNEMVASGGEEKGELVFTDESYAASLSTGMGELSISSGFLTKKSP